MRQDFSSVLARCKSRLHPNVKNPSNSICRPQITTVDRRLKRFPHTHTLIHDAINNQFYNVLVRHILLTGGQLDPRLQSTQADALGLLEEVRFIQPCKVPVASRLGKVQIPLIHCTLALAILKPCFRAMHQSSMSWAVQQNVSTYLKGTYYSPFLLGV